MSTTELKVCIACKEDIPAKASVCRLCREPQDAKARAQARKARFVQGRLAGTPDDQKLGVGVGVLALVFGAFAFFVGVVLFFDKRSRTKGAKLIGLALLGQVMWLVLLASARPGSFL